MKVRSDSYRILSDASLVNSNGSVFLAQSSAASLARNDSRHTPSSLKCVLSTSLWLHSGGAVLTDGAPPRKTFPAG